MKNIGLITVLICALFVGCTKDSDNSPSNGCEPIITSNGSFEDTGLVIDSVVIDGDELKMKVGYSGCNNNHDIDLIWDGSLLESLPPQVYLLVVDNEDPEACLAFFVQDECFDLSPMLDQITNEDQLIINFYQDSTISLMIDL